MNESSSSGTYRIAHLFADYGAESEALAAYGSVTRYTIDPEPNPFVDETHAVDLVSETPRADNTFDLALLHPKCTKWSRMTSIDGDPDEHENQIPRTRELAESIADHWIIENQPQAPLDRPTVLNGKMFGLPIHYERAFETSFPVKPQVRERGYRAECSPYFSADRSAAWWRSTKGYVGDYPKKHLAKNCVPAVYVHTLVRHFVKAVNEQDRQPASDNDSPPPRTVADDQATLVTATNVGVPDSAESERGNR